MSCIFGSSLTDCKYVYMYIYKIKIIINLPHMMFIHQFSANIVEVKQLLCP